MYAIIEVGGMQFKVTKGATVCVPRMEIEPGKKVDLDRVLLIVDGKTINIGTPVIADALVKTTVISHFKDKKVLVFKKKRRKTYKVLRGHRQQVTELKIENISTGKPEAKPKKEQKEIKSKPVVVKKETKPKEVKTESGKKKVTVKKSSDTVKTKKAPSKPVKKKEA